MAEIVVIDTALYPIDWLNGRGLLEAWRVGSDLARVGRQVGAPSWVQTGEQQQADCDREWERRTEDCLADLDLAKAGLDQIRAILDAEELAGQR